MIRLLISRFRPSSEFDPVAGFKSTSEEALSTRFGGDGALVFFGLDSHVHTVDRQHPEPVVLCGTEIFVESFDPVR